MQINAFSTTPANTKTSGKEAKASGLASPSPSPSPSPSSFAKVLSRQKEQAAKPAAEAKEATATAAAKSKPAAKAPAHAAEPTAVAHRGEVPQPAKPLATNAKDGKDMPATKRASGKDDALPTPAGETPSSPKLEAESQPARTEVDAPPDGMNPWMALMQTLSATPPAAPAPTGDGSIALTDGNQATVDVGGDAAPALMAGGQGAAMVPSNASAATPKPTTPPATNGAAADPAAVAKTLASKPQDSAAHFGNALAASLATQPQAGSIGSEWRARERDAASTALPASSLAGLIASAPAASGTQAPEPTTAAGTVNLPVPIDSPEFAPSLAATVSVLARDGVQEARINLHPAEMGPITVQITVDGSQARVDFGADMAATRSALEAGLPELASALRDAGLTLSGGGVFDQAQSSRQGSEGEAAGARRSRGGISNDGESATTAVSGSAAAPRRVTVHGLDEYA